MADFLDETLDIPVYFKVVKNKYGIKRTEIPQEKALPLLEKPEEKDKIQVLNTKWKVLGWKKENDIWEKHQTVVNTVTGVKSTDGTKLQESRIKEALIGWDATKKVGDKDVVVPLTIENIEKLPPDIMRSLLTKYTEASSIGEEELGK